MNKWIKASLVFVVGLLLGSVVTVLYINHCMNRLWMNSGNHHHVLDRLACELNLTADQKTRVEAILESEDANVNKLRDMDRDKFRAIRDKIDAEIRPLLTPDQIKKLDALKEQREHPPAKRGFWGSFRFLFHPMPQPPAGSDSAPCSAK
jgi:Spy/CpxP family protein refolding chaperone